MYDSSIAGIRSNLEIFAESARRLQNIEKADLPGESVTMMTAETGVAANIAVLRASLEASRYVIDILA